MSTAPPTLPSRGKYTESDARTIFVPVLEGLQYLHDVAKIVHRDLKLENILLEDSDDLGSVKIADFGLAKQIQNSDEGARGPSRWTHTHTRARALFRIPRTVIRVRPRRVSPPCERRPERAAPPPN